MHVPFLSLSVHIDLCTHVPINQNHGIHRLQRSTDVPNRSSSDPLKVSPYRLDKLRQGREVEMVKLMMSRAAMRDRGASR